jgi:predicted Zn-dependent peptidase
VLFRSLAAAAYAGTRDISGLKLCRNLEDIGAKFTATSDKDTITYEVAVEKENAAEAISYVANAIVSPPRASYVINESKHIAYAAYKKYSADDHIVDLLHEAAYGEGTPLGSPKLASSLDAVDADEAMGYRTANFKSGNIIVTASGISADKHDDLSGLIEKVFAPLATGTGSKAASPYVGGYAKVKKDICGQTYLGLAFPTPTGEGAKSYKVLGSILSSKLSVAPKGAVTPFLSLYSTEGIIGAYAKGTSSAAASTYLEGYVAELKAIAKGVSADVVKAHVASVSLEDALAVDSKDSTQALLSSSILGVPITKISDYSSVSASSVAAAASKILSSTPSYAVLGNTLGAPTYPSIISKVK